MKWEREGARIGKGPQARIRTRDSCSATALYVGTLHTRLLAPTLLMDLNGDSQNYC